MRALLAVTGLAVLAVCSLNAVARPAHARLLLQQECNVTAADWSYEGADCPTLLPDCEARRPSAGGGHSCLRLPGSLSVPLTCCPMMMVQIGAPRAMEGQC